MIPNPYFFSDKKATIAIPINIFTTSYVLVPPEVKISGNIINTNTEYGNASKNLFNIGFFGIFTNSGSNLNATVTNADTTIILRTSKLLIFSHLFISMPNCINQT